MRCMRCGLQSPAGANFCPNCGARSEETLRTKGSPAERRGGWSVLTLSLLLSLGVSLALTFWLGWPVFILGAILPFFWRPGRRAS